MPKAQKSTPGGDKECRDTIRSNRNPLNATSLNANMPKEVQHSPSAPRSREISPKTNELWCAWCTENGRVHNHSTANCAMLKNANSNDQWKVITKNKVCKLHCTRPLLEILPQQNPRTLHRMQQFSSSKPGMYASQTNFNLPRRRLTIWP